MCDIVFEKTKCRGGRANRMSVNAEAAVGKVLWKSSSEKFCKIHKKTTVPEKRDPSAGASLWIL